MQGVVWPLKLDDIFLLVREWWRVWLAGAKLGQWPPGLPALGGRAKVPADGGAVLTPLRMYPAELGGMSFEVSLG